RAAGGQQVHLEEGLGSGRGAIAGQNPAGGALITRYDRRVEMHPAREYLHDHRGRGKMIIRVVVAHPDLYLMMAAGDGFEPDTPDVVKFLNSFKLTVPPPQPTPFFPFPWNAGAGKRPLVPPNQYPLPLRET